MASWSETYAPVREARRLWERTALQLTLDVDALSETGDAGVGLQGEQSPLADPPVSLSASLTPLPDALGTTAPADAYSPSTTAGKRPAEPIGAGDQAPAVPGTAHASEGRPGSVTTNDNAVSAQSLPGTRALTAVRSIA